MCKHEVCLFQKGQIESYDIDETRVACVEYCEQCGAVLARPTLVYHHTKGVCCERLAG